MSGRGGDRPSPGGQRPERQPPVVDVNRYGWVVGAIGVALVIAFSLSQLTGRGAASTGVAPGRPLRLFAAPLAGSGLNGVPNPSPSCDPARHDPRALNLCLLVRRGPVALAFFVPQARRCVRQVDALQELSSRFPGVAFAAVAVGTGRAAAARLVRSHRWTIPVAYDSDGEVGALYAVAACPMVQLARRGGIVAARLIGDRWASAASLAPRVRALVGDARR